VLSRPIARSRSGITLIELLVALAVGGTALGVIAAISFREQQTFNDLAAVAASEAQLRDAGSLLPVDLRPLSVATGDIRAGEARDTSLELRATIASAIVCDTTTTALILAPSGQGSTAYASVAEPIEAGDTAWLYSPADTSEEWRPFRIAATSDAPGGPCGGLAPRLADEDKALARVVVALETPPALASALGFPLRVTRPRRYSLYRASDGLSYLGERDWNPESSRFNIIQPVSGPFAPAAEHGLVFRYLDSTGASLVIPVANPSAIALVQVDLKVQSRSAIRAPGHGAILGEHADSASVVVFVHNRR
jgi:type II secretory pathway pseudopilin PulG